MNTTAHIAAIVSIIWFAVYAFNTLSFTPLGVALIGIALVFIALTLFAIDDDKRMIGGGGEE